MIKSGENAECDNEWRPEWSPFEAPEHAGDAARSSNFAGLHFGLRTQQRTEGLQEKGAQKVSRSSCHDNQGTYRMNPFSISVLHGSLRNDIKQKYWRFTQFQQYCLLGANRHYIIYILTIFNKIKIVTSCHACLGSRLCLWSMSIYINIYKYYDYTKFLFIRSSQYWPRYARQGR